MSQVTNLTELDFLNSPATHLEKVHQGGSLILSDENGPTMIFLPFIHPAGPPSASIFAGELEVPDDFEAPLPSPLLESFKFLRQDQP